jgi:peptidyl-prolyl cis-trans isomerase B (cyclophilin B)
MFKFTTLSALVASAVLMASAAQAADVFPVKAYAKPDEPVLMKFVEGKGEDAKKAVAELGAAAGKVESLFTPAAATEIAGADGTPAFKIFNVKGEEQKLDKATVKDGTVNLSDVCSKLKDGGTFFLTWKDATPLVIEVLFSPAYQTYRSRIAAMTAEERKKALEQFGPVVTHMELAQIAVILTDKGVIKAKFWYDDAPRTVDNYIDLARQGFYDGSTFHRIISGFMIQGGDGYTNAKAGTGGPGYDIVHEFSDRKHVKGVLSMARSGGDIRNAAGTTQTTQYDTAGSQFFIMHGEAPSLDGTYSAFGEVIEGLNIVDVIAKTPTSDGNGTVSGPKPKIQSIKILPATAENYGLKK